MTARTVRRACVIGALVIALVAACNRIVDLTPVDASFNAGDAPDLTDAAGGNAPADAPPDATPDASPSDAAPDAI